MLTTAIMLFASLGVSAQNKKNFNLRQNDGVTVFGLSGGYKWGFGNGENSAAAINLSVTRLHKWVNYGFVAGGDFDGTFSGKAFVGPGVWRKNFYVAPALTAGMGQVRKDADFLNPVNGDVLKFNTPQPKFLLGGQLQIGYNFNHFGLFTRASYERAIGYAQSSNLGDSWEKSSSSCPKNIVSIEAGIAYVMNNGVMRSGDNCLNAGVAGGYSSSMGAFASIEVKGYSRLGDAFGHQYGGLFSFYFENGNAEIGAEYDIVWHPCGSDGIYNASIGLAGLIGQYRRSFEGMSYDDPERAYTKGEETSFGGGFDLKVSPLYFQAGRVNIEFFASIGLRAICDVRGKGDQSYGASSISDNLFANYAGGLKVSLAL